jgi:hypothetical protein
MAAETFDLRALSARWTESRREAANRFLDSYETTVGQLADAHVKTANAVALPGVVTIAEAHAAMSRDVAGAYVSTARKLLEH